FTRAGIEAVVKNNSVLLAGEVSSTAEVDIPAVVRETIRRIGYTQTELGFDADTAEITVRLNRQSADISRGVDCASDGQGNASELGAGDQGMVFGYATDETAELMPLPAELSHKLAQRLTETRESGILPYLRPDGKTQTSVRYINDRPTAVTAIVISAQHDPNIAQEELRNDILREVVHKVVPRSLMSSGVKIFINPTGRFVIGGPTGDSGLTGRKIIVDTYGGAARHGGGAFSGKDPTKVDRSAAYMARYAAKNIVAAGLAKKAELQIAYAIGVAEPVSINVNTFGTGKISDERLCEAVKLTFDFRPQAIIDTLDLRRPIYADTAAYGHFGRRKTEFTWERTDIKDKLISLINR
ncbi:MAG: methionine adenosyltransferase, partial [Clostridiales bacterium]|nr:methionine adenosyltransferase [Clostridiales bacterium]